MATIARGKATVYVEFADNERTFAFRGEVRIVEDSIVLQTETPGGRVLDKEHLDRTEVVIHAPTRHGSGR